jgi:hypothetical protein
MANILDKFKNVTGFDITSYFTDFSSFILSDYAKIVNYCQDGTILSADVISRLKDLLSRMQQVTDLFSVYINQLSIDTVEIWEVLDYFEATKVTLWTVSNSDRWLRSTKNVFRSNVVNNDFILRQGQDFEQLASEVGYSDPANDWSQIALNNNVIEEDYTFEGGNKLKISFVNNANYFVNCVIDSISGEKIYGLDLDKNLIFSDTNDFVILGYRATIIQQTEILVGLVKGSVPEFPLDGIDKVFSGSNVNAIQYPALLRQQSAVFEKDDRYKSIAINKFDVQAESVAIDIQITTRLDEVLNEQLVLV